MSGQSGYDILGKYTISYQEIRYHTLTHDIVHLLRYRIGSKETKKNSTALLGTCCGHGRKFKIIKNKYV